MQIHPTKPYMPCVKLVVESGDLGLTPLGVSHLLELILGDAALSAVVARFDAKIDDTSKPFVWWRKRIHRRFIHKPSVLYGDSTMYLGNRTGDQLKVYDKVAEAMQRSESPWSLMEVCTRIEKTVHVSPADRVPWHEFLPERAIAHQPFANVLVGNIDVLIAQPNLKRLVDTCGVHDTLYELRRQRNLSDDFRKTVLKSPPVDLSGIWERLVRAWVTR